MATQKKTGLDLLREPFPPHQISKLPKPYKKDSPKGQCKECGGYHGLPAMHLDYVGHAALTDRLLDCDPAWAWEPLALDEKGYPVIDNNGGMWIKLTVCGVTRLGYGDAQGKTGGDAMKERIGDCLLAGTLITTNRGEIPIENVKIGDLVPTRIGWKRVIDHWLSSEHAPVKKVIFSNGNEIIGTPHHKVPTTSGVKRIEELRNGDIMYSFEGDLCLTQEEALHAKILNLMDGFTGESQAIDLFTEEDTLWQQQNQGTTCIGTFMSSTKVRFLKDSMFTTRIMILTITRLKTLWQLILQSMRPYMLIRSNGLFVNAMNAVWIIQPFSNGQNGAVLHARKEEEEKMGLLTSSLKNPLKLNRSSVKNAALNLDHPSRGLNFAEVSVVESMDAGTGEVWNLSVEDQHEYVANGILVNNCLRNAAMRFGAALDLWHKGDLHIEESEEKPAANDAPNKSDEYAKMLRNATNMQELIATWQVVPKSLHRSLAVVKDEMKAKLQPEQEAA